MPAEEKEILAASVSEPSEKIMPYSLKDKMAIGIVVFSLAVVAVASLVITGSYISDFSGRGDSIGQIICQIILSKKVFSIIYFIAVIISLRFRHLIGWWLGALIFYNILSFFILWALLVSVEYFVYLLFSAVPLSLLNLYLLNRQPLKRFYKLNTNWKLYLTNLTAFLAAAPLSFYFFVLSLPPVLI
jgi:hypothetical protein